MWLIHGDIELATNLSPIELIALVDLKRRKDITCSIAVTLGTSDGPRAGFIPIEDLDLDRTLKSLENPDQLPLVLL